MYRYLKQLLINFIIIYHHSQLHITQCISILPCTLFFLYCLGLSDKFTRLILLHHCDVLK